MPTSPADASLENLQEWVGRTATVEDVLQGSSAQRLFAMLDREDELPVVLPPLWHWLYFLSAPPTASIDADGHPRRGGFLPPVPLPRRMWAAGSLQWKIGNPLRIGETVRRDSRILSLTQKSGSSGDLIFVTVEHEIHNARGIALTEHQDIVYRAAARLGGPSARSFTHPGSAAWQRAIVPDEVLLFRYSALTFNAHRIHYDRPYATTIEGYPALVVQGPLIATLLADLARRVAPGAAIRKFQFKAVRPCFNGRPLRLHACPAPDSPGLILWALDSDDHLAMQANCEFQT
nr:MaoC family dehydratase N-terminal domain-containing protein [Variovorax sp. PBS-H4]